MPTDALLAVLVGAVLHASWNTAIKSGADKRLDTVLVAGGSALIAALVLPALPLPSAASLPYILASTLLQIVYYRLVAASYRAGSMSHAYPLMRGTAPLIVAAASGALLGEHLSPAGWAGTLLVCGGVLALALGGQRSPDRSRATGFALANAVVIAGYTLVDGVGVRLSDHAAAYALWVFLLTAPPMIAWTAWTRPRELVAHARARWAFGLGGGACAMGSYGLALWAMTRAPIATAAALRETSILFGLALAGLVLKETIGPARIAAGIVITLGAATLRLPG